MHELPVGGVIIDHQHFLALQIHPAGDRLRRFGGLQVKREPEGRALSLNALDTNFTTHQLNELLADRQAQAGAAIFAGGRAIRLGKFAEQVGLLICTDANAGILNLKSQLTSAASGRMTISKNCDFTGVGELNRITD